MAFMKEYDHLKIEIKDIALATNNFDPTNVIGVGGFGKVYKGELTHPDGRIAVAFKKLDRRMGQGNIEFWKEIMMLSNYKHENLISLMHFCIDGNEMILVYEYAARGSLDHHLGNASLTWAQRLRVCIGAARGLQFLHNPTKTHQRVIHRDIKSANILIDEKWTAKIADFGLSKAGPANQPQTYLITNAVGTPGYCDPLYWELGFLSKESDVYSFGVVLFEVLCGRLCFEYCNGALKEILVHKWRSRYVKNRLDEIIFLRLKEQMDPGSLNSFSAIAYRCVKKTREERPMMAEIVKELEFALEQQEIHETLQERVDFAELMPVALPPVSNGKRVDLEELLKIADLAVPPLLYGSQTQLFMFLRKGFLVDDGQTWVSVNMNREVTEVISATKCIVADDRVPDKTEDVRCKFGYCFQKVFTGGFKVEVNTQFLTPHVTYIIYIVFRLSDSFSLRKGENIPAEFGPLHIPITYKLDGETHYSKSCFGYVTAEGWQIVELYQFTSYQRQQNFSIDFLGSPARSRYYADDYAFEGIALRPVVNETCDKQEEKNTVDTDREKKLPTYLIEFSKDVVQWTTEKELYFLLRKGFLVDNDMVYIFLFSDSSSNIWLLRFSYKGLDIN